MSSPILPVVSCPKSSGLLWDRERLFGEFRGHNVVTGSVWLDADQSGPSIVLMARGFVHHSHLLWSGASGINRPSVSVSLCLPLCVCVCVCVCVLSLIHI